MIRPRNINQPPPHQRRHRRPRRPHPVFIRGIQVEQEEGHDVRRPSLRHSLLAPGFENGSCALGLWGIWFWRAGQIAERRYGFNLVVEVVVEGFLEGIHYAEELGAVEVEWGAEGFEVGVEGYEACEE